MTAPACVIGIDEVPCRAMPLAAPLAIHACGVLAGMNGGAALPTLAGSPGVLLSLTQKFPTARLSAIAARRLWSP